MINRELNFRGNSPLLYLISTPIGNLDEFSPRAISVLQGIDYVAAEDTRNSGSLLTKFGIKKPFIMCHEHNEEEASTKIISLLKEGKTVAYMSDAGYPAISDPGERLVARCISEGIKVSCVNGSNAALCALVCSGLPTKHFYFYGFLPSKPSERRKELETLKNREDTMIFYEAPHRIDDTLKDMKNAFGGTRRASIGRELTKAFEEFIRGDFDELCEIDPETLKGEMVIVVDKAEGAKKEYTDEDIVELLKENLKTMKSKDAIAAVVKTTGTPKNAVYDIYLSIK